MITLAVRQVLIVCSFLIVAGTAFARQTAPPEAPKENKKKVSKETPKAQKKRMQPRKMPGVTALDELVVIGRIQKPEVFYVLGRSDFRYKGLDLKKSFVERIKKSVRSNPF